jgi:hypothetical protein
MSVVSARWMIGMVTAGCCLHCLCLWWVPDDWHEWLQRTAVCTVYVCDECQMIDMNGYSGLLSALFMSDECQMIYTNGYSGLLSALLMSVMIARWLTRMVTAVDTNGYSGLLSALFVSVMSARWLTGMATVDCCLHCLSLKSCGQEKACHMNFHIMSVRSKFTGLFTVPAYAQLIQTHVTLQFFVYSHVFQQNSTIFSEYVDQCLKLTKI